MAGFGVPVDIGIGVNLAARLESACKQYGAHILNCYEPLGQPLSGEEIQSASVVCSSN